MAGNIEYKSTNDWRARASATANHVDIIGRISNISKDRGEFIDYKKTDDMCLTQEAKSILNSGTLDCLLNFSTSDNYLSVNVNSFIEKIKDNKKGSSKSKQAKLERDISLFVNQTTRLYAQHSNASGYNDNSYDLVNSDLETRASVGARAALTGMLHGGDMSILSYDNRCGIAAIEAAGKDYRSLALKFVLLLNQMKVFYTFQKSELLGANYEATIDYATDNIVMAEAMRRRVIIDCLQLSNDATNLLTFISGKWPQQVVCLGDKIDVYSSITIESDDVYFFMSQPSASILVNRRGFAMPPDDMWDAGVKLFSAIGAIEQLFEVVRDTRGIFPLLSTMEDKYSMSNGKAVVFGIQYPKSIGTNYMETIKHAMPMTQTSQFVSSSASLLLDGIMMINSINNLHSIVEKLGLTNKDLYGDYSPHNERLNCVLRDHGYVYHGEMNSLPAKVCPWNPFLSGCGVLFRKMLDAYVGEVINIRYNYGTPALSSLLAIPLSKVYNCNELLTTASLYNKHVTIDNSTKMSHISQVEDIANIVKTVAWLEGVGLGSGTVPLSGLSYVCNKFPPDITSELKSNIWSMGGNYELTNVVCIVDNVKSRIGATGMRVSNLFRPRYIAEANAVVNHGDKIMDSITRLRSSTRAATGSDDVSDKFREAINKVTLDKRSAITKPQTKLLETPAYTTIEKPTDKYVVKSIHKSIDSNEGRTCIEITREGISDFSLISVPGDGNCGPRALGTALNLEPNAICNAFGTDTTYGIHWYDDDLAAVAALNGANMMLYDTNRKSWIKYDAGKSDTVYLKRTGTDDNNGHFEVLRPRHTGVTIHPSHITNVDDEYIKNRKESALKYFNKEITKIIEPKCIIHKRTSCTCDKNKVADKSASSIK